MLQLTAYFLFAILQLLTQCESRNCLHGEFCIANHHVFDSGVFFHHANATEMQRLTVHVRMLSCDSSCRQRWVGLGWVGLVLEL